MKKMLLFLFVPVCFVACNNKATTAESTTAVSADTSSVTLPYKAMYSSNWTAGKQSDVATVLNSYKAWETGDMNALRATFSDSVEMYFSNGEHFKGGIDSMMHEATKYRDSLSKVELIFDAWMANQSVDKDADWVSLWYKEIDTHKNGKVDSIYYQDDNRINKNGKIDFVSSKTQKLK